MSEVTVSTEEIPDELKERDQWLLWDSSAETPRQPHWRGDFFGISWSDPADWHTFEEAVAAAEERDSWGIGYVTATDNDGYARGLYGVIDIDGAADEDGHAKDWVPSLEPFAERDVYMEWSPSGTGVHIPVAGLESPEWWSDIQFEDADHQGVDVLTNKFCTFTGDTLRGAGEDVADNGDYVEEWLIQAHKAITGEDPTKDESNDFGDASDGGRRNRDEFLDEDDIRDALDHIDPNVGYNTWRDVGFALDDFFSSDRTALSVFTAWSRGGSKWDDEAEDRAEKIINGASSGGGRTIGTVIELAREEGWEMPSPRKSSDFQHRGTPDDVSIGDDTDGSGLSSDASTVSWDYVTDAYDEETKWGRYYAAEALDDRHSWMYVVESETLWVYDEDTGYFNRWGEQFVANVLEHELGTHYSRTEKQEVIARLEARHQTHRETLNARFRDDPLVCVGNGVVNIRTGELLDHSPEYQFIRGVAHDWNPDAVPERTLRFLRSVTKRDEDMWTLIQHLGHGLMPGHPYKAFIVMFGPGDNGKSALGAVFRNLVGDDNAAGVELRDFDEDNFATGDLPGKMLNIGDDLSGKKIKDASMLKRLTSPDDTIRSNEKYEKTFDFENEAAMFFSGNEPPKFAEQTAALKGRLYPIHMPYRFTQESDEHKDADPQLVQKIVSDEEEMAGLLALAVQGAQELNETGGHFAMPESPDERMRMYEAASDPIRRFVMDCLEQGDSDDVTLKDDVYDVYATMCRVEDEQSTSDHIFKSEVSSQAVIDVEKGRTRKLTADEEPTPCWKYLRFGPEARQYMSDRLENRYFPDEEEGTAGDDDGDGDGGDGDETPSNPWNARPLSEVAKDPTGYATATVDVLTVDTPDHENAPAMRATVKDETTAIDVISWDDPNAMPESGTFVIENAQIGEHNGQVQLTIREGVTDVRPVQPGVGYTEGETPDEKQDQLDDAPAEAPQAASDGGVPEDAEGVLPDAQRLVETLQRAGKPLEENKLVAEATLNHDMGPDRAEQALSHALGDRGLIIETDDGYVPN